MRAPRLTFRQSYGLLVTGLSIALVAGLLTPVPASAAGPTPAATSKPAISPAAPAVTSTAPVRTPTTTAAPRTAADVAKALAVAGAGAAAYSYDSLGRIVGMVAADGSVAKWTYDATGNVTGVTRPGSPAVAVLSAVPALVRAGEKLTLSGKGFSATAASNTVTINGAAATVISADSTQLVVTVPAAATSGTVVVTNAAGTSTFSSVTVISGDKPTIGTFTPAVAAPGDSVTLQATNLDAEPANSVIAVNGMAAAVTTKTATSVTFTVPPLTTGGKITLSTPAGTVISASDLFVLPAGFTAATIGSTGRITVGTKTTVSVPAGKTALRLFDAAEGDRFSLVIESPTTSCAFTVKMYDRRLTETGSETCIVTSGSFFKPTAVGDAGTRQVLLQNTGTTDASISVTVIKTPPDVAAGALALDGTPKTVTITSPGQLGSATFAGTAGQKVYLESSATTSAFNWQVIAPDGTTQVIATYGARSTTLALPATGTYKISVNVDGITTGSITFAAWNIPADVNAGTLTLDGVAKTVTIPNRGQKGYLTFAGTSGQKVFFESSATTSAFNYQIIAPDGTTVVIGTYGARTFSQVLPATGAYKILVYADGATTGSITFAAWNIPADVNAGTLTLDGVAKTVTIPNRGQKGYLTFAGTTGQKVFFESSATTSAFNYQIIAPDGTTVVIGTYGARTFSQVLPATGAYKILVYADGATTGSITFAAWNIPADVNAGTLTLDGVAKTVTIPNRGQKGYLTFAGTAAKTISLVSSNTTSSFNYQVIAPDGTTVLLSTYGARTVSVPLTSTGTHKILVYGDGATTGSITFSATVVAGLAPGTVVGEMDEGSRTPRAKLFAVPSAKQPAVPSAKSVPTPTPKMRTGRLPDVTNVRGTESVSTPTWHPDTGNLDGRDWLTRRAPAEAEKTAGLKAATGVTALAGQVLELDGQALKGVTVRVGTTKVTTDDQGRFLLRKVAPTTATVIVDGRTANRKNASYGTFRVHVKLIAGRTTPLDATVWMPRLDQQHTQKLSAPTTRETVLTTPDIPGLQVRIPAGSVVKDVDGKVVDELGITAIPIDRPPFPLPRNGIVPVYFTIQPGGGSIFPQGAQVVYPNYTKLRAGTVVDFYDYDPKDKGWYVYGHGTVSANGEQVVPDAKTRIWNLDGAMFNTSGNPEDDKNWWQDFVDWLSGDPVDVTTGLMTDRQTDLAVTDTVPISLTRTYWQGDGHARDFGVNQAADYNMFLSSELQYQEVDLNLPTGGKVHYVRTSPGTGYTDAIFGVSGSPGTYAGSTITQTNGDWVLRLGDGTKYFFPWYSRVRAMEDRNGNRVTYTRVGGSNGEVSQITSPHGRWISLQYDASNRVSSARDNIGRTVSYTYDTVGRLATVTDVAGKVRTYTYDTSNRVTSIKDARQISYLAATYDANGRVATQTLPVGKVYGFGYTVDAGGRVSETRVTQPNGSVRRVVMNADGFVTSDTQAYGTPLARATTLERDTTRKVTGIVDAFNRRTTMGYDSAGRVTSSTVLAGTADAATVSRATYGAFDLPLTTTDAAGKVTTYAYDSKGNLTTVTDPAGRLIRWTYRFDGQPATVTDPAGKISTYGYANGTPVSVTDPLGRITKQFIDAAGRLVLTTDALGASGRMIYDVQNQVTRQIDPNGAATTFAYDANGNLTQLTNARGGVTKWAYDDSDQVTKTTDALLKDSTYTYDPAGRQASSLARSGLRTTFAYDGLDRPTTVKYGVSGTTQQSTVTYAYDNRDRVASLTDTAGGTTTFAYDVRDRMTTTTGPKGAVTYAYDPVGRPTTVTAAGQTATTNTYNTVGQLTGATQGANAATLGYDTAGRLSTVSLPNSWKQTYSYDNASQLSGIAYSQAGTAKGDLTYAYDANGRRRSVGGSLANALPPQARSALVYDADNRLTSAGGAALTYDADGNLKSDGATAYTWDARGQLSGVSRTGLSASFTYDAVGDRSARTVSGTTTGFTLGGANANTEQNAAGATTATLLSGGVDEWFSRTSGGTTDAVLTDDQGSVVGLGAANGTMAATYSYDPYGAATPTGSTHGSDLGYTGRQDDGTGLMYYRNRYYSPTLQRFVSEDPTGVSGGLNLYAYGADDPTNTTDPTGNNPLIAGCIIGGLTDGAISYVGQRLSGRKVDWGWNGVGGSAAQGCAFGMLGGVLGEAFAGGRAATRVCNCFPAGTTVQTESGAEPIEKVEVGDKVWAKDLTTGKPELRTVTGLFDKPTDELVDLDVGGTRFQVTPDHPFWLDGKGWTEAADLKSGDRLADRSGSGSVVRSVQVRAADTRVYNFQVEGDENYYVTDAQLLVHNCSLLPSALLRGANARTGYSVYYGVKNGTNVYVGITNDVVRRAAEHGTRFTLQPFAGGLTRGEARAIEQALIVRGRSLGFENINNSISPLRGATYRDALAWGEAWLKANGL